MLMVGWTTLYRTNTDSKKKTKICKQLNSAKTDRFNGAVAPEQIAKFGRQ